MFLHYFHHIVTFAGSFWAYGKSCPPLAIVGITMNYGVHAIMYFYYFLMAIRAKPKWFNPIWITVGQLAQMAVGICLGAFSYIFSPQMPPECRVWVKDMMYVTMGGYLSFGLLFGQLFFGRYFSFGTKASSSKLKTI
jgi:elongation of very long chain fatty acids protein 6